MKFEYNIFKVTENIIQVEFFLSLNGYHVYQTHHPSLGEVGSYAWDAMYSDAGLVFELHNGEFVFINAEEMSAFNMYYAPDPNHDEEYILCPVVERIIEQVNEIVFTPLEYDATTLTQARRVLAAASKFVRDNFRGKDGEVLDWLARHRPASN